MTKTLITGWMIAAGLLLAGCETTATGQNKPPVQSDQNPAHHMHYRQSSY
ncbi:MAG: hypothetical protein JF571_05330 [Asticcacaulis sp.]|nr:hypothetical protein [Asticcacaulis sp.]